jgi:hypothetical protein
MPFEKRITATWHKDADGESSPELYVGKRYFHPGTATLHTVTVYSFDAERAVWLLKYEHDEGGAFAFSHTIRDFTRDGRFIELKVGDHK